MRPADRNRPRRCGRGGCRGATIALGLGAGALTLLATLPARAYCRTSTCSAGVAGELCTPADPADCGKPLYWAQPCFGFDVQQNASKQVSWDTADATAKLSFLSWLDADCGAGSHPNMRVADFGPVECTAREYNQNGGNANIVVFRDDAWPYAGQWNTLALTTVTYSLDSGEIYDADMEINSSDVVLTTSDTNVQFDLQSIMTHEAGHMLGLAHSKAPDSTMGRQYMAGDTSLRTLTTDDVTAICTVYPPNAAADPNSCDPTPRHGFQSVCGAAPEEDSGCTLGPASRHRAWPSALFGALGAGAMLARRRRRNGSGS
jgi:hypothetical protein